MNASSKAHLPAGLPAGSALSAAFFRDLALLGDRHKTHPSVFLSVWCFESNLNPAAVNAKSGARGLNQMNDETLRDLGAPMRFEQLSGEQQLAWIERLITAREKINGGPFQTAGRYYHANAFPRTMARGTAPDTIVYARDAERADEREAYEANKGLDQNHDGRVTLGDLETLMQRVRRDGRYENAFARMGAAIEALWPKTPRPAPFPVARGANPAVASPGLLLGSIVALGLVAGRSKRWRS